MFYRFITFKVIAKNNFFLKVLSLESIIAHSIIFFLVSTFPIFGFGQSGLIQRPENKHFKSSVYRSLEKGMVWPEDKVIPQFATPAKTIDLLDLNELKLTKSERLLFTVLQGLVNKTQPRIMLVDRAGEGKNFWIQNCDLRVNKIVSPWDVFNKYKNEVSGLVVYSNKQNEHFINLATTIGGIKNALPIEDSLYQQLQAKGFRLPVVTDLRPLKLNSPLEVYEYIYSNYWKQCNKRLYISLAPSCSNFIRDIAVATKSVVIWLDIRKQKDSILADKFLRDMKQGSSFVLGWWPEERTGVGLGTTHGIATIAADFFENATVWAGQSKHIEIPAVPRMPKLENKIYVSFYMSDGDNIQYCQHSLAKLWGDKNRGSIPINWTISPALIDVAPQILNYYYKTATDNDCFASGPSGVGYALIYDIFRKRFNLSDDSILDSYTRFSQPYLERSGIRVITIWDDISEKQMEIYAKNCRYLYGNTREDWEKGEPLKTYVKKDRMPFVPNLPGYTNNIEQIYKTWEKSIREFDGSKPLFLTSQGIAWRMTAQNLVALKERLEKLSPGNIIVCRGDHFFNLFNQANNHYFNLCLLPDVKIASSDKKADNSAVADGSPSLNHQWIASKKGQQWIQFDFNKAYIIDRYVIRHAGAAGMDSSFNTKSFKLEVSSDNKSWKTVSACSNNTDEVSDVDISPTEAQYVRLQITHPGKDNLVRIGDVEFYGKKTD